MSVLLASVMFQHIIMQEEEAMKQTNSKCLVFTRIIKPLTIVLPIHKSHNISEHSDANTLISRDQHTSKYNNAKCHEVTLRVKLLASSVT